MKPANPRIVSWRGKAVAAVMRPSRRIPSLEEQCLAQLSHYETHNILENLRKLRDIALIMSLMYKLSNYQITLILDVTGHLHLLSQGFIHQFRLAPTLPGADFIHFTRGYCQSRANAHLHSRIFVQECGDCDRNNCRIQSRC